MASKRALKRKKAGKMTRNQQRKRDYATQQGWKHGAKGTRKGRKMRLVKGKKGLRKPRPTLCPRTCAQCYPGRIYGGKPCRRGRSDA